MGSRQPLLALHTKQPDQLFFHSFFVRKKQQQQELDKASSDFWFRNGSQSVARAEPEREHS